MKERPILMSGQMIQAILADRKTQTRRVVKNPDWFGCLTGDCPHNRQSECDASLASDCPYGQAGDRLWVRETWCCQMDNGLFVYDDKGTHLCHYAADGVEVTADDGDGGQKYRKDGTEASPWRPSIFMPRWASRLTLEVVSARVEPLQAITEADALAEGFTAWTHRTEGQITARRGFMELWDKINGKRHPWDANQYVWAITFRRIEP